MYFYGTFHVWRSWHLTKKRFLLKTYNQHQGTKSLCTILCHHGIGNYIHTMEIMIHLHDEAKTFASSCHAGIKRTNYGKRNLIAGNQSHCRRRKSKDRLKTKRKIIKNTQKAPYKNSGLS